MYIITKGARFELLFDMLVIIYQLIQNHPHHELLA